MKERLGTFPAGPMDRPETLPAHRGRPGGPGSLRAALAFVRAVIPLAGLAACGSPDPAPNPGSVQAEDAGGSDLVRWETVIVEDRSPGCPDTSAPATPDIETGPCAQARLEYPSFEGEDVLVQALRSWTAERILEPAMFEGGRASSAESVVRDFVAAHDAFRADFPDFGPPGWELDRSVAVKWNAPPVVVLVASEMAYAGGAHPNYWASHQGFDARTGEALTLDRVFRPGALPAVQALLEARFRQDAGLDDEAPLSDGGLFEDLPPMDNLDWGPRGLTFHYSPYAVGPWSMGSIQVLLAWADLEPHLAPDVADLLGTWLPGSGR